MKRARSGSSDRPRQRPEANEREIRDLKDRLHTLEGRVDRRSDRETDLTRRIEALERGEADSERLTRRVLALERQQNPEAERLLNQFSLADPLSVAPYRVYSELLTLVAANVLEDAGVDLSADLLVLEVFALEDPVEVVQLVLDLLQLEVVDRRDLHLADDLEARLSLADPELDVQHVVSGKELRSPEHEIRKKKKSGSSGCDSGDSALFFRKRNENK